MRRALRVSRVSESRPGPARPTLLRQAPGARFVSGSWGSGGLFVAEAVDEAHIAAQVFLEGGAVIGDELVGGEANG
jgi:hypothetical protein